MVRTRDTGEHMYGKELEGTFEPNPEKILSTDLDELYGQEAELTDDEKEFITRTAEMIQSLKNLSKGDTITFESSNRSESITATVTDEYTGNALHLSSEDGSDIEVAIDSEGAANSLIMVYVPYIVVIEDERNAGDMTDLTVQ